MQTSIGFEKGQKDQRRNATAWKFTRLSEDRNLERLFSFRSQPGPGGRLIASKEAHFCRCWAGELGLGGQNWVLKSSKVAVWWIRRQQLQDRRHSWCHSFAGNQWSWLECAYITWLCCWPCGVSPITSCGFDSDLRGRWSGGIRKSALLKRLLPGDFEAWVNLASYLRSWF